MPKFIEKNTEEEETFKSQTLLRFSQIEDKIKSLQSEVENELEQWGVN